MYQTTTTLAQLATHIPAASRIFHRYRLDFCCGGAVSLSRACRERGLDAEKVLEEIESESRTVNDEGYASWNAPRLVAHIISRYHEPLRPELDRLVEMAAKVERVHADKRSCPRGLAAHLRAVRDELLDHMAKEEQVLFPAILAGAHGSARIPIKVLTAEHDAHAVNLRRTRALAHDFDPPIDACNTWRALYLGLLELERQLMEHIHLENNVLFPLVLAR